ncbi:UNVERIFIED_CONTAM: Retrovirus-related Pol polyprotein from transposon TNT 1-94 [Sesamum latifolium]|uniref:Retrovirus-related Pol polyprotein from transposon TNT 1-94 n=1 Tax=Sesamum latifolium TaxID=2727402 RepID=A0AAW2VY35_9LAMI
MVRCTSQDIHCVIVSAGIMNALVDPSPLGIHIPETPYERLCLGQATPAILPEGSSPEERLTFEKWHEDNRKVRSIILASMTNEIQKQYDRLEDVPSIMLRMKDVYAVPDWHIRYAAIKAFFGTKMTKDRLCIVMGRGFDLQSERQGCQTLKRKKGKGTTVTATASTGGAPPAAPKGKSKRKVGGSQRSKANNVCMHYQGKGHWKRECPQLLSNPRLERSRWLSKDEMILRLGDGKAVAAEAVGSLRLVVSNHIRIDLKDYYFVPKFQAGYQTDSTTEAEYIAASEAAKEAVWIKKYIQELGVVPSIAETVVIFCDNNGAIAQAKEPRSHHHSKHILRRCHLLREMVSRDDCRMDRVSSAENTANPLTKPMSQIAHTQHLDKMGLRSMGDWL